MWKLVVLVTVLGSTHSQQVLRSLRPGVEPAKGRIIGGHEAVPHSSPWQALLSINGYAYCGGALISSNYVVTAGHCGIVISTVQVYLGLHNRTDPTEEVFSIMGKRVIMHPGYDDDTLRNDITLIELAQAAPINDNIKVVPLPPRSDVNNTYFDKTVKATGWGLYQDVPFPSIFDMSIVLLEVEVPVSNLTECAEYYNDEDGDYVVETNVCTSGYRNKGTCDGDSGGPLVLNGTLIAITSFGTTLCELCSPSVYTRIANYLDWISDNTDLDV